MLLLMTLSRGRTRTRVDKEYILGIGTINTEVLYFLSVSTLATMNKFGILVGA